MYFFKISFTGARLTDLKLDTSESMFKMSFYSQTGKQSGV